MSSGDELRELVRRGVERMRKRRRVEHVIADAAARNPESIARGLIVAAQQEHGWLQQELRARFGFTAERSEGGYVCRFDGRRPSTPEQMARWTDLYVGMVVRKEALRAMQAVAAYHPEPDRARMVCNAFLDAMREGPAALYGAVSDAGFEPVVREYAAAMAGAWVRSHLKAFPGSKVEKVLKGEDWATELVNAAALARAERDPDAPLKRSTRFRDTLPRQADGRRQKAPGPADLVNRVSAVLEGRDTTRKPEPPEREPFTLAEQERLRRTARDAALTPQEREVFEMIVSNPGIKNPEIAAALGISPGHARVVRHNIKKRLGA